MNEACGPGMTEIIVVHDLYHLLDGVKDHLNVVITVILPGPCDIYLASILELKHLKYGTADISEKRVPARCKS